MNVQRQPIHREASATSTHSVLLPYSVSRSRTGSRCTVTLLLCSVLIFNALPLVTTTYAMKGAWPQTMARHGVELKKQSAVEAPSAQLESAKAAFGRLYPNNIDVPPPFSGTYTVGSGGDYSTLTAAINALNIAGISGPTTLSLTDASYITPAETFPLIINALSGASATNRLTIKPAAGVTSLISGSSATSIIKLHGTDYVTLDGSNNGTTSRDLTITNTSMAGSTAAVWVASNDTDGAQNNTVKNVNVAAGVDQRGGTTFATPAFGIISSGGASLLACGIDNDNNTYDNNFVQRAEVGIASCAGFLNNPNQNTTITHNLIGPASFGGNEIGTTGIGIQNENAATIRQNEIRFVGDLATAGGGAGRDRAGIVVGGSDQIWPPSFGPSLVTNSSITRNIIHDIVDRGTHSAVGITLGGTDGTNTTGNFVANNMIYNVLANGDSGFGEQAVGIGIFSGKGDTVAFNSVYMTGDLDPGAATSASGSSFGLSITLAPTAPAPANLSLLNNILFMDLNSNTATVKHGAIFVPASFSWGTGGSNYNDLYYLPANTQSITGRVGASNRQTLADWQAVAPGSGQDSNSIQMNPLFTSGADLHVLAASPVLNAGTTVSSITVDFDGDARLQGPAPDIGADELAVAGTPPSISVAVSPSTTAEDGATNLIYTFTRTGSTAATLSVNFSVGGTATFNTDYAQSGATTFTASSGTVTFGVGSATATVTINPTADITVEPNETVILTVTSGTGYSVGSPSAATGTINNDDATPNLSINDVSVAEGNSGTFNAVFTVTLSAPSSLVVTVNFATANGTAIQPGDYQSTSGLLTFNPGELSKNISVPVVGNVTNEPNETFFVNLSTATNANISDSQGIGNILNDDTPTFNFSLANYSVSESGGSVLITVNRSGDPAPAVNVDYVSTDNSNPADFVHCSSSPAGTASSRCDFNTALGTLQFAASETSKTFNVLITQDSYVEGTESLQLFLGNPTGGSVLGVQSISTLQILDDVPETSTNPILDARNFVRQHYHDFLNREPDQAGWDFWTDNITKCNDPARRPAGQTVAQCTDKQRETTSGAFFLSPEFQYTGFYIYCVYKGSLGRQPTFLELMRDVQQVSRGIVVNGALSGPVIEQNRAQYELEFIQRAEFVGIYGALTNQAYVDKLFQTTGTPVSGTDKQALVNGLNGATETRASVLHKVVNGTRVVSESQTDIIAAYGKAFTDSQTNAAFVQMEYLGYLRRNSDDAGFAFWLGKMNFYGDFIKAEMVKSFLVSPEYLQRFAP